MRRLEQQFLESYKKAESLCNKRFSAQYGVSEYLSRMESAAPEKRRIAGWDDTYKTLKHLRSIRTKIAHETGDSGCEKNDCLDLKNFYRSLTRKRDPLSRLERAQGRRSIGRWFLLLFVLALFALLAFLAWKFLF